MKHHVINHIMLFSLSDNMSSWVSDGIWSTSPEFGIVATMCLPMTVGPVGDFTSLQGSNSGDSAMSGVVGGPGLRCLSNA